MYLLRPTKVYASTAVGVGHTTVNESRSLSPWSLDSKYGSQIIKGNNVYHVMISVLKTQQVERSWEYCVWQADILHRVVSKACEKKWYWSRIGRWVGTSQTDMWEEACFRPRQWSNKARTLQGEQAWRVPETARKPAWPGGKDEENCSSSRNSYLEPNKTIIPSQNTMRKITFYIDYFK